MVKKLILNILQKILLGLKWPSHLETFQKIADYGLAICPWDDESKWWPESDQRNPKSPKRSVPLIGDRLCWNDQKHNGTHFSGQKRGKNALKWKIGQERDIGKVSPCISSPTVAPLFVYVYISAITSKLHSIALLPLYSTTLSHKDVNIVDL